MRRPASPDDGAARRQRHGRRCRRCGSTRAPLLFDVSELFTALVGGRWRVRERREAVRARRGGGRGSRRVGAERPGPRERSWRACGGDAPLIPASVALLYNLCSAQVEV